MKVAGVLPKDHNVPFQAVNQLLTKKTIQGLIDTVYRHTGQKKTVIFADRVMELGFKEAARAGISFGKDDMVIPDTKVGIVEETRTLASEYEQQYADGLITRGEKYNKVVDAWAKCTDRIADEMMGEISRVQVDEETGRTKEINSVYMMSHSGARGSPTQMRQLAAMRGLMAKPSGEIIETPIVSNFKEGLTVLEYFNSTHGARKGLADTALKTANSGYLTRRLVDVAQDCIVKEVDCGTEKGISHEAVIDSGEVVLPLSERILGRTVLEEIRHPDTDEVMAEAGTQLDEVQAEQIELVGIQKVKVRSPLTCETPIGVCATCYGRDLSRGEPVNVGEAVGVIAAQSIGEPGTQLTMRTFHVGGTAQVGDVSLIEATHAGTIKLENRNVVRNSSGDLVVMGRNTLIKIQDKDGSDLASFKVTYGTTLRVDDGDDVARGQRMADWDPYTLPILTESSGKVTYEDLVETVSFTNVADETTGLSSKVVQDWRSNPRGSDLKPALAIRGEDGEIVKGEQGGDLSYLLPVEAILSVEDGADVTAGDVLARIPTEGAKTRDITGGLPRVAELFEGAASQGPRGHRGDRRKGGVRTRLQEQAPHLDRARGRGAGPGRVPRAQGQAHHRAGRRLHREGRVPARRQPRAARHPGRPGHRGAGRLPDRRDPRGVPPAGRAHQRQAHRGDRSPDAAEGRGGDRSASPISSRTSRWTRSSSTRPTQRLEAEGKEPATARPVLLGITKASLQTRSFISAASFQETTRVLTDAAVNGKIDTLDGLKENVIVGRLIPAGHGRSDDQAPAGGGPPRRAADRGARGARGGGAAPRRRRPSTCRTKARPRRSRRPTLRPSGGGAYGPLLLASRAWRSGGAGHPCLRYRFATWTQAARLRGRSLRGDDRASPRGPPPPFGHLPTGEESCPARIPHTLGIRHAPRRAASQPSGSPCSQASTTSWNRLGQRMRSKRGERGLGQPGVARLVRQHALDSRGEPGWVGLRGEDHAFALRQRRLEHRVVAGDQRRSGGQRLVDRARQAFGVGVAARHDDEGRRRASARTPPRSGGGPGTRCGRRLGTAASIVARSSPLPTTCKWQCSAIHVSPIEAVRSPTPFAAETSPT